MFLDRVALKEGKIKSETYFQRKRSDTTTISGQFFKLPQKNVGDNYKLKSKANVENCLHGVPRECGNYKPMKDKEKV